MALKKNQEASDISDIRNALEDIQAKLTPLLHLKARLAFPMELMEEIRRDRARDQQQDNRLDLLKRRADVFILTGLQLKHRAGPGAANASTEANGWAAGAGESSWILNDLNLVGKV